MARYKIIRGFTGAKGVEYKPGSVVENPQWMNMQQLERNGWVTKLPAVDEPRLEARRERQVK